MTALRRWFGLLIGIAALHMAEQLLFGLDELDTLRRGLGEYYALFSNPDFATVLLVTIVMLFVLILVYGVLRGGAPRTWVMGFFVLLSFAEVHHVIETVQQGRYVPGLVTGVVWVAVGVMLARATLRQARSQAPAMKAAS